MFHVERFICKVKTMPYNVKEEIDLIENVFVNVEVFGAGMCHISV